MGRRKRTIKSTEKAKSVRIKNYFMGGGESSGAKRTKVQNHDTYEAWRDHESLVLQTVFPDDIWILVANELSDSPETLETLMNSARYFGELLKGRRTLFLAKKVLRIITGTPDNTETGKFCNERDSNPKSGNISLWNLLEWRTVCSSWRSAFDQLVEEQRENKYWLNCYDLSSIHEVKSFWRHFQDTHLSSNDDNPFLGRCLSLVVCEKENRHQEKLVSLLDKFGGQIRHLNYTWEYPWDSDEHTEEFEVYLDFVDILKLAPNLETLSFKWGMNVEVGTDLTHEFIRQHPLPSLFNLKSLKMNGVPPAVLSKFLRQYNQIHSFWLEQDTNEYEYDLNLNIPSLEKFGISFAPDHEYEAFFNPPVHWPLKSLTWDDRYIGRRLSDVFMWIKETTSAPTLGKLCISFNPDRNDEDVIEMKRTLMDSLHFRLNFCNVREVSFSAKRFLTSLDFLLSMGALEVVRIWTRPPNKQMSKWPSGHYLIGEAEKRQIVQFIGYEHRMYESNIWTLFGKLKTVEVMTCSKPETIAKYHRSKWIKQIRKK